MKPASRKFKNRGSGVYRKNLHGWGMVEARQQVKYRKLADGHKIHQEGPKEYRVNPQSGKRPNPKAKKQSPVYKKPKAIIEQADPWLGTAKLMKKDVRNDLKLKHIPMWRTITHDSARMKIRQRVLHLVDCLPEAVRTQVMAVVEKHSKSYIMTKTRIMFLAYLIWHSISKISILRFAGIVGMSGFQEGMPKYLKEARDTLNYDISDAEILKIYTEYTSLLANHKKRTGGLKGRFSLRRDQAATDDWRKLRQRENHRRQREKLSREKILTDVFVHHINKPKDTVWVLTAKEKEKRRQEQIKQAHENTKIRKRAYNKKIKEQDPDAWRAKQREYYAKYKKEGTEYHTIKRKENPEFYHARDKIYNARKTPEQKKHKNKISAEWKKQHPEMVKEYNRRANAKRGYGWQGVKHREQNRRSNERRTRERQLIKLFTVQSRAYPTQYKEKSKIRAKEWRQKNKAKENETKKKYFKKYPEKKKRKNVIANERTMIVNWANNMLVEEVTP